MRSTVYCRLRWSSVLIGARSFVERAACASLRWNLTGKGKRGGTRVIYYWAVAQDQILMLFIYPKQERGDLTPAQLRILRQIVEKEYP